ncbi:MAG: type II toxin-antitoxin system Phd/YefM family antitoxin [Armatimonadetes bacterium]|nr:type II toxin-antitoxin system Phd/YefM family antitoxin [Armatimonadota bacterium]
MKMTVSRLRENIYQILDEVLATGVPVDVQRKGGVVRLAPLEPVRRTDRLVPREYLRADPDEFVHLDWSGEWQP